MKEAYIDIGELDFSIRLSAYMNWLKDQGRQVALVMTYPGRKCLYEDRVEKVIDVPKEFYKDFDIEQQCGSRIGICNKSIEEEYQRKFVDYFNGKLPEGYCVSGDMEFVQPFSRMTNYRSFLFTPYPYREKLTGKKEILVLPRCRRTAPYSERNLSKMFYIKLINRLCDNFGDYIIRTMGLKDASYDITEVKKDNYINFVGKTANLQKVIDRCQVAIGAIGSHSTPLVFTMLQGVPSFLIGKDRERVEKTNWSNTKFYFVNTGSWHFAGWADEKEHDKAINEAILFFKEC